jgi:hypothetical protein
MAKQKLSRLELYLMGKGPTARAQRLIYKESLRSPGAKPKGQR